MATTKNLYGLLAKKEPEAAEQVEQDKRLKRVLDRLCALLAKNKKAQPALTATLLWKTIAIRADAAVAEGEKCEALFKEFTQKVAGHFGTDGGHLFQIGPQKDPVRIYEKAGDD